MELQRTIVRDHIRTLQAEAAAERLLHQHSDDDEATTTQPAIGKRLSAMARPATVAAATTGSRVRPVGRHDGRDDDPCLGASSPC